MLRQLDPSPLGEYVHIEALMGEIRPDPASEMIWKEDTTTAEEGQGIWV